MLSLKALSIGIGGNLLECAFATECAVFGGSDAGVLTAAFVAGSSFVEGECGPTVGDEFGVLVGGVVVVEWGEAGVFGIVFVEEVAPAWFVVFELVVAERAANESDNLVAALVGPDLEDAAFGDLGAQGAHTPLPRAGQSWSGPSMEVPQYSQTGVPERGLAGV